MPDDVTGLYPSRRTIWQGAAELVEAPRYKAEGREFDSYEVTKCFNLPDPSGRTITPRSTASNRNEYQESFGGLRTATQTEGV
jgi:hypothetical protein